MDFFFHYFIQHFSEDPSQGRKTIMRKKSKIYGSHLLLFVTHWTVAYQAPRSVDFSRQEYESGLPFPSPGDLPDPGIESGSPALAGGFFTTEPQGKPRLDFI